MPIKSESFKIWLEKTDRELAKELVFDAAKVSDDDDSLSIPLKSVYLDELLNMGVIKSNSDLHSDIDEFIKNATRETTLNDLIQKLTELFSGQSPSNNNNKIDGDEETSDMTTPEYPQSPI